MKVVHLIACSALLLWFGVTGCAQYSGPEGANAASSDSTWVAGSGKRAGLRAQRGYTRQQIFDQLDTDRNGAISRSEAEASPDLVAIFVETDANGDGTLSATEFDVVQIVFVDGIATGATSGTGGGGVVEVITPAQPNETQPGMLQPAIRQR
jgi:hypothetical protein